MWQLRQLLIGTVIIALLSGCASAPPISFLPDNIPPSKTKLNAEIRSISVSIAQENESFGECQVGFFGNQYEQSFKTAFKEALEEAIVRSTLFKDNSELKAALMAKVMKFESPMAGINFDTEAIIRYELLDRASGETLFFKDVVSNGSVDFNHAFVGAIRFAEARNRAMQSNIKNLLTEFEKITLHKLSKHEIEESKYKLVDKSETNIETDNTNKPNDNVTRVNPVTGAIIQD